MLFNLVLVLMLVCQPMIMFAISSVQLLQWQCCVILVTRTISTLKIAVCRFILSMTIHDAEEVRHGHLNAPQLLINARVITKILSLSHKIM